MQKIEPEPRWPSAVAMIAIGGLFYALPSAMTVGPDWLALVLVAVLITPAIIFHRRGMHRANQIFGYLAQGVVTLSLVASLTMLVLRLPSHKDSPAELLRAAAALWISNMLVFASWYWRLDAGGPHARHLSACHTKGDFLFPQMTLKNPLENWSPGFVDYLFLAYNTSTAFSPTDSPVLSPWAKVAMMVQASISFATVSLLAARAVNIL